MAANPEVFEQRIDIPAQNDDFDSIRAEYANMLRSQLARGNNGLQKQKYLTFGIEADSYKAAKTRLERIELDLLNNFRKLGVQAKALDGKARLELMHRPELADAGSAAAPIRRFLWRAARRWMR